MIAVTVLIAFLVIALVVSLIFLALRIWEPARIEKARIEREMYKAEYRLHEMASEAFGALLDAARAGGFKKPK